MQEHGQRCACGSTRIDAKCSPLLPSSGLAKPAPQLDRFVAVISKLPVLFTLHSHVHFQHSGLSKAATRLCHPLCLQSSVLSCHRHIGVTVLPGPWAPCGLLLRTSPAGPRPLGSHSGLPSACQGPASVLSHVHLPSLGAGPRLESDCLGPGELGSLCIFSFVVGRECGCENMSDTRHVKYLTHTSF